jgi:hypothetical protein
LKEGRINLRDYLAGFDLRIKIRKQLCDISLRPGCPPAR